MEQLSPQEKSLLVCKTMGALVFSVFGFAGFFFSIWRQNWNSGIWCLLLEITCVSLLMFNKMFVKNELHAKFSANFFRVAKFVVIFVFVGCLAAGVAYIVVGVQWEEKFDVRSHYAAAPVALLTALWSFVLFFDFRKYETLLE